MNKEYTTDLQKLFHDYSFIIASTASSITLVLFLFTKQLNIVKKDNINRLVDDFQFR